MAPVASLALSVLAILVCGTLGALAGFAVVSAFGWTGTPASIVAAVVGMGIATLAWVVGVALLRKLRWLR